MKRKLHRPVMQSQRWKFNNARPAGTKKLFVAGVRPNYIKLTRKKKAKAEWLMARPQCGPKQLPAGTTRAAHR